MLREAFGEQALSQARTFEWVKRFKDGRESVEDDNISGRPSTCTTPEMIATSLTVKTSLLFPTESIYVFCIILRTNIEFSQHSLL